MEKNKEKEKKVWVTKVDSCIVSNTNLSEKTDSLFSGVDNKDVSSESITTTNRFDGLKEGTIDSDSDDTMPELADGNVVEEGWDSVTNRKGSTDQDMEVSIKNSSASLPLNDVGPKIKSILKRTDALKRTIPQGSAALTSTKLSPIALCARIEDSPSQRASNLQIVNKDFSKAAMDIHIAANSEFMRLDSMQPP